MPVSVATSLALHAGAVFLYLHLAHMSTQQHALVISNVDLLIRVRRAAAIPKPISKTPTPPSTWNFLKMALPSIPKPQVQQVQVKLPEAKRPMLAQPKLEDKGRLHEAPKVEALDLGKKRLDLAQVEERGATTRRIAALAAAPALEEVGTRRVRNLPQAMALEEKRREAVVMQALSVADIPNRAHGSLAAPTLLQEAAPAEHSKLLQKIAAVLPAQEEIREFRPEMRQASEEIVKRLESFTPPPLIRERKEELKPEEKKKAVEIEGPLADRKIVSFDIPQFPDWAKQQGIVEADVAIRFWVSSAGDVLPDIQVERTSGYGRLDRLAMDSLLKWKFAPLTANARQWGVITFRFILE